MKESATVKKRNANMELLRLISMLMVVFLHGLWKGENLETATTVGNTAVAWIFESLSIVAVNVFILISGYFMSRAKFKSERLISLSFQTLFYSLGVFLACGVLGVVSIKNATTYELLQYIFPLHMGVYWFVTCYVVVYILSPVINKAVDVLSKKQLGAVIVILLAYESVLKSILPVRFEDDDNGYSIIWFLTVYLIGAYFRKYGFKRLTSAVKGFLVYFAGVTLIFSETMALKYVSENMGHFGEITTVATEYNHIFNILAAVGLFAAFANMKEIKGIAATVILKLSPMALGIYLLHESPAVRYEWQHWAGVFDIKDLQVFIFAGRLVLGVLCVVILGLAIDFVRKTIFDLIGILLAKTKLYDLLIKINERVNGINEGK